MKRIFTIFSIALLAIAACEPIDEQNNTNDGNNTENENNGGNNTENENNGGTNDGNDDGTPQVRITSKTSVTIGSGSVMGQISYELINPVDGLTVEATANVDWIGEFDYKNMGRIGYKAERNPGETPRDGVITVSYGESSVDINVTQEGNPEPTIKNITMPQLMGSYYGIQQGANGLLNYYLVFAEEGVSNNNYSVPNAKYYIIDLYLEDTATPADMNHITVPSGTYEIDKKNSPWPGSFKDTYSWYQINDETGMAPSKNQIPYEEGSRLIVEDGKITLEAILTIDGILETHIVTFEGDYSLKNEA